MKKNRNKKLTSFKREYNKCFFVKASITETVDMASRYQNMYSSFIVKCSVICNNDTVFNEDITFATM